MPEGVADCGALFSCRASAFDSAADASPKKKVCSRGGAEDAEVLRADCNARVSIIVPIIGPIIRMVDALGIDRARALCVLSAFARTSSTLLRERRRPWPQFYQQGEKA
ncbi:MAG: hypothetical protein WCS75_14110 [Sphingomonas sp.]